MTSADEKFFRLLEMPLAAETDVVLCRNRARAVAAALHFDNQHQVKIATAVSEIARNAFRYARHATASFHLVTRADGPQAQSLLTTISDLGPGIANLDQVLAGTYRSKTGMGAGIRGAKRLMDHVEIRTAPSGTSVELRQNLRRGVFIGLDERQTIVAQLGTAEPTNPLDELATQNRELTATLEQVSAQGMTLEQLNEELNETNRGVVALYDELETIHRVGRVVASKLDLDSLLQAITDATTDLSGAEFGAFLLVGPKNDVFVWQSVAGSLVADFPRGPTPAIDEVIPNADQDIFGFDDAEQMPAIARSLQLRSLLACPLRNDDGQLVGALIFGHREAGVFTERTRRILPTVALQASIGVANARLYRHVQTANEAKAQFLAVLSHELRTPLNPVFAVLTSLEENPALPADAREDLVIMRRNLQLEAALIDDLLDLTRISEGKMPLKFAPLDVNVIIRAVLHTCSAEIDRKRIGVNIQLSASAHYVDGDEVRLQQALWNLVNNAVKFTPEGGSLRIETANTGRAIVISLIDSGRGIEADALERVFTAFEQENALIAARFGGLGLGLAISKGIVDAHHGHIRAESDGLGHGATFAVTLPTVKATSPVSVLPEGSPETTPSTALRILMIDDHEDSRVVMSRMLQMRGYVVTQAATVAEAIAKFRAGDFDLVVSDLGLPDGSGHDLMIALRSIRPISGIALSGYGMENDLARSREVGFSRHLIKPVDFAALEAALAEVRAPIA